MAATLKDISKETGINICTVSQVLSSHPKAETLRPELRQKILETAKRLNYSKNQMAASIAGKHGRVLAFVHSDMGLVEYTGRIQNGVIEAANERGYTLTIHHIKSSSNDELIRKLMGWRVAGVIFHVPELKVIAKITKQLEKEKIPCGTVNLSNPDGIGVTTDDAAGIEKAVQSLYRKKHKKIAYTIFRRTKKRSQIEYKTRRINGFLCGMKKYYPEDPSPMILDIDPSKYMNQKYMSGILDKLLAEQVDGVICEADPQAVALNNAAAAKGVSVPQIFSLIGFGGSMITETTFPKISTIVQNFEEMGRWTTFSVIDAVEDRSGNKIMNQLLPVSLELRDSVMKRNIKNV